MSSIHSPEVSGEELLDLHIKAARQQFDAAEIEKTARRLRAKLSRTRGSRYRLLRFPALAGAASAVLVAILAVTLFLPGNNGTAFAQAQRWLESFHTLQAESTVFDGDSVSTVLTWFDGSGDTRIEAPDATTIVRPAAGMIYILRSDGQNFARQITSESIVRNSTELLDNILAFRGQANLLSDSRTIEGIAAVGYELEVDGNDNIMWIDPEDGRPLRVESQLDDGVTISTVLRFDVPLPENAFEIPDEIQLIYPSE